MLCVSKRTETSVHCTVPCITAGRSTRSIANITTCTYIFARLMHPYSCDMSPIKVPLHGKCYVSRHANQYCHASCLSKQATGGKDQTGGMSLHNKVAHHVFGCDAS